MSLWVKIYVTILILILIKIAAIVLENIQSKLIKDIRRNKLRYGHVISRKDLASIKSEIRIKNRFLYNLAFSSSTMMRLIPYKFIYDDSTAKEQDEYLHWCTKFLIDLGYGNIDYACDSLQGCSDIICTKDNNKVYVQCILLRQDSDTKAIEEDNWAKLGAPDVQKFVGAMTHDNIFNGIIVTTGDFSSDAIEYAKSLPAQYSLQLIDGCEITKTVRRLREKIAG